MKNNSFTGYLRSDGRKGIRNNILVIFLVECAHHVARKIAQPFEEEGVQVVGFSGCYPNNYANKILQRLGTHPNTGGAMLVSLGCECFDRHTLYKEIKASGRPVEVIGIQENGGTQKTVNVGRKIIISMLKEVSKVDEVSMDASELVIGTICGGSDGTSGITGNPAAGYAFDKLIEAGGIGIFEETGELLGCEEIMKDRAVTAELAAEIDKTMVKTAKYYSTLGHGSFASGNADGGLSTIEEKSMGAYAKSGSSTISGIIKPGDVPKKSGLYLLDVIPDGEVRFGFPNINDTAEIIELIACGSHMVFFVTGRGSVVGAPISPVIKICANPETYERMQDDMDINAGRILNNEADISEVGTEIFNKAVAIASGDKSKSESLGHEEFVLTYKSFEPIGPSCLPV